MALTTKDVLRLIELLQQNEWLRDELRRILLPPNFEAWMKGVDERLMRIESTLGELRDAVRESEFARKARRFLGRLAKNIREDEDAVFGKLYEAEAKGKVSAKEVNELLRADLLLLGEVKRGRFAGQTILLVCEISTTVSREDVQRSLERAQIARRTGFWAVPLVSSARWSSPALKKWALSENVLCGQDGDLQSSPNTDWDAVEQLIATWKPNGG